MQIKTTPDLISEKTTSPSVCESCGDEFTCGATLKDCWCVNIELSDTTREHLKDEFKNCLCEKCLEKNQIKA